MPQSPIADHDHHYHPFIHTLHPTTKLSVFAHRTWKALGVLLRNSSPAGVLTKEDVDDILLAVDYQESEVKSMGGRRAVMGRRGDEKC